MKSLDGIKFAEMVQMGAHHLSQNANFVDSLNVFPVPDGDTGGEPDQLHMLQVAFARCDALSTQLREWQSR